MKKLVIVLFLTTLFCTAEKPGGEISVMQALRRLYQTEFQAMTRRPRFNGPNIDVKLLYNKQALYRGLTFPSVQEVSLTWKDTDSDIAPIYQKNVDGFLAIKKDLDTFFEYQRLEPRIVRANEKRAKEIQLSQAYTYLRNISMALPDDAPSVQTAKAFLKDAYAALHPTYVVKPHEGEELAKSTRVLRDNEFLLWDPEAEKSTTMPEIFSGKADKAKGLERASHLPARSFAFINDDPEILEWAQQWARQGYLGKGSKVEVFSNSEDFIARLRTYGNLYDVVVVDWVLEEGYALNAIEAVRKSANKNAIVLMNSALMDDQVKVKEMYENGLDGFVSSIGWRADTGGPRLAVALYNYDFYKTLHGWER